MRVLICSDRIGALSSAHAGRVLAEGWRGAEVRTVGEAGYGFADATADGWGVPLRTDVLDGVPVEWAAASDGDAMLTVRAGGPAAAGTPIPYEASSAVLGVAVATALRDHRPRRLLIDLAGVDVHDAGAGLLAALGAAAVGASLTDGVAGLMGLQQVDLDRVRTLVDRTEIVGVVPAGQRQDLLLGLRGITSRRGRAVEEDAAVLLTADATLQRWTGLVAPGTAAAAGGGACGGLGWAVLALGGRLATGPELGLAGATGPYDLVVTGCGVFDFVGRGGGVVTAAAELAATQLAPCIVVAGEVLIGSREMRTMGIEAAYAIRESSLDRPTGGDPTTADLAAVVTRVSRSWRW